MFHHEPLHVREREILVQGQIGNMCCVSTMERIILRLISGEPHWGLLDTQKKEIQEEREKEKNKALLSFLNYSCPGGMLSLLCFCQLTHVQVCR